MRFGRALGGVGSVRDGRVAMLWAMAPELAVDLVAVAASDAALVR
jgi:hypothetical protein